MEGERGGHVAAAINIRRSSHNVTAKQIDEVVGAGNSGGGGENEG